MQFEGCCHSCGSTGLLAVRVRSGAGGAWHIGHAHCVLSDAVKGPGLRAPLPPACSSSPHPNPPHPHAAAPIHWGPHCRSSHPSHPSPPLLGQAVQGSRSPACCTPLNRPTTALPCSPLAAVRFIQTYHRWAKPGMTNIPGEDMGYSNALGFAKKERCVRRAQCSGAGAAWYGWRMGGPAVIALYCATRPQWCTGEQS